MMPNPNPGTNPNPGPTPNPPTSPGPNPVTDPIPNPPTNPIPNPKPDPAPAPPIQDRVAASTASPPRFARRTIPRSMSILNTDDRVAQSICPAPSNV